MKKSAAPIAAVLMRAAPVGAIAAGVLCLAPAEAHSNCRIMKDENRDAMAADCILANEAKALRADIAPEIEAFLPDSGLPSITIVAFNGDKILWAEAFGRANIASEAPATLDTVYNTGSTFKILVATAILQLVEQGVFEIDRPVNDYLVSPIDDFTEQGTPITLRHMLAHRSGLPASTPVPDFDIWSRTPVPSIRSQNEGLKAVIPPGEAYEYCNTCFPLYAEMIENATGQSLSSYLTQHVLAPVGAKFTAPLYPDAKMAERMAFPYEMIGRTPYPMPQKFLLSWMSGDTYMRPLDLARFLQIFLNDGITNSQRLLSPQSVAAMCERQFDGDITLGFLSRDEDGVEVLSWDGGVYGGSATYELEPDAKIGVYVISNSNQTHAVLSSIAHRIRDILRGNPSPRVLDFAPEKKVRISNPPRAMIGEYSGDYEIVGAGVSMKIEILGDHLSLTNPAGKRFSLVFTGKDSGILIGPRENVRFERGGGEEIKALILTSGDSEIRAVRRR